MCIIQDMCCSFIIRLSVIIFYILHSWHITWIQAWGGTTAARITCRRRNCCCSLARKATIPTKRWLRQWQNTALAWHSEWWDGKASGNLEWLLHRHNSSFIVGKLLHDMWLWGSSCMTCGWGEALAWKRIWAVCSPWYVVIFVCLHLGCCVHLGLYPPWLMSSPRIVFAWVYMDHGICVHQS